MVVELDRLSHGSKDRHFESLEHAEMLRTGAQKAVTFLENGFEARNSHLRALTAEGTTLDTITFRSEQLKDLVSRRLFLQFSRPVRAPGCKNMVRIRCFLSRCRKMRLSQVLSVFYVLLVC